MFEHSIDNLLPPLGRYDKKNGFASDGTLTKFLRGREDTRTIVFMDEFEKLMAVRSGLGWDQAAQIVQALLEPWQEGVLTDQGESGRGKKIRIHNCIFILTSNVCFGVFKHILFGTR